ncbi:hypothetical protein KAU11_02450, partial [Candidatus Babeliales bacterium]|nr:hypothetical protein [Candidatus Babeliales bacterium]
MKNFVTKMTLIICVAVSTIDNKALPTWVKHSKAEGFGIEGFSYKFDGAWEITKSLKGVILGTAWGLALYKNYKTAVNERSFKGSFKDFALRIITLKEKLHNNNASFILGAIFLGNAAIEGKNLYNAIAKIKQNKADKEKDKDEKVKSVVDTTEYTVTKEQQQTAIDTFAVVLTCHPALRKQFKKPDTPDHTTVTAKEEPKTDVIAKEQIEAIIKAGKCRRKPLNTFFERTGTPLFADKDPQNEENIKFFDFTRPIPPIAPVNTTQIADAITAK